VFLDKDGTLIEDVPYNVDPGLIRLTSGAAGGLRRLHAAGYRLFIVSNQSGVARGYFAEETLAGVWQRVTELLGAAGVPLAGCYYCPHHPDGTVTRYAVTCDCRKPHAGLILRGAREHGVDLAGSWVLGDKPVDVEAGHRAGCRTVLLGEGCETDGAGTVQQTPDYRARDLSEAADRILASSPHCCT
jgi:histidinol-phosphate phosphatase family protein